MVFFNVCSVYKRRASIELNINPKVPSVRCQEREECVQYEDPMQCYEHMNANGFDGPSAYESVSL